RLEQVVGLDVLRQRLERGRVDVELESAVIAREERGGRAGPDLPPGAAVTQARAERSRDQDQRRLVGRAAGLPVQDAERWPLETGAGAETQSGGEERAAGPSLHHGTCRQYPAGGRRRHRAKR